MPTIVNASALCTGNVVDAWVLTGLAGLDLEVGVSCNKLGGGFVVAAR